MKLPEINLPEINPIANLRLPTPPSIPDHIGNPAKWMHERIVHSIVAFEKELKADEEIGARLVSFGQREVIHITDVGYWGPDLVTFQGNNVDGHPVELLQHISQISVLLVALPVEKETPRRIGFELERRLKEGSE